MPPPLPPPLSPSPPPAFSPSSSPSRPSVFLPIAALTGVAFLLGVVFGGGGVYLAMHQTASTPSSVSVAPRPVPTATPSYSGPQIAPAANASQQQAGITQGAQGNVSINSGRGVVTAMPRPDGTWLLMFGMHTASGDTQRKAMMSLINKDAQKRLGLTQQQQEQLDAVGPLPKPDEAVQQNIRTLFDSYVAAGDADKPAAEKALLEAVEQDGETRGPVVDQWIDRRMRVLTAEQQNWLFSRRGPSRSTQW